MNKKLPYDKAEIELLILNSNDVIATSGTWDGPLDGENDESSSDNFGWT